MMNFCGSALNPTVDCSTVSTDGYEVTNLVSSESIKLQKGFLAYSAIKPPVTITLNFFCNVNVSHIILWSQVGYQKSTGFEIFASSASEPSSQDYQKAAFGYLKEEEIGIIFYRRAHNCEYVKSTEHLSFFPRKAVLGSSFSLLNDASSLQIKIIKTNSSIPALARVEVWGQPSKSCAPVVRCNVFKLWRDGTPKKETVPCAESKSQLQTISATDLEFEIPEEFLDSVTCTIMALPFILPCGKVVDRSTLDRHEQNEAKWGRAPSDPFTGKMFTDSSQPIPAAALKTRIDKFLIEHSERQELSSVPRTTGRKKNIMQEVSSTVPLENIKPNEYFNSAACPTDNKEVTFQAASENACPLRNKRPRYIGVDEAKNGTNVNFHIEQKPSSLSTHEEEIDWSLNNALESTLSGLPTYTKFNKPSTTQQQCAVCSSDKILFKLPCEHFLCRTCLVMKKESNELSCSMCKACFQSSDPLRYHV